MNTEGLIQAAQRGDQVSFNDLVMSYQDQVFRLAYWTLPDEDSALQAAQAAFIEAYRDLQNYSGMGFSNYLLQKTAIVCSQRMRQEKDDHTGRNHPGMDLSPTNALPRRGGFNGTLGGLISGDQIPEASGDNLHRYIRSLPGDQRLVVVLVDVEGLDYAQTAEILGIPVRKLQGLLAQARMNLSHIVR
jgi:RNA polymerase sigma-70 factor (ECF subfamily)